MKNHVRIIVQGGHQSAADFAIKLEDACQKLYDEFGETPTITHMTSNHIGRQTATIQFITKKS